MIKFFRQIRKQLLGEGKTGKYLKYAIGEIVLVMVGILLALQVNNWNEVRKLKQLEQTYYCKLSEDINQDLYQIKKHLSENDERISNSNQLIHLLQRPHPNQKEVILSMRDAVSKTTYTFKPSIAAFEDLKSSGNLSILKDLTIKARLIKYYAALEGYIDVIDVNSDKTVSLFFNPNNPNANHIRTALYKKDFYSLKGAAFLGNSSHAETWKDHPNVMEVQKIDLIIHMLLRGRIDFYFADLIVTGYIIKQMGLSGRLEHISLTHIIKQGSLTQMRFGLKRSYPEAEKVIQEIDMAIQKTITPELHNKVIGRYI